MLLISTILGLALTLGCWVVIINRINLVGFIVVMLRLSKKVDYGLMALIHLAQNSERSSWSAREIARSYNIPHQLMAKVLQKMVRSRLVVSHQGIRGGYALGRSAHRINVAEVIEAIEGPFSITNCISENGFCLQFEKCTIKSPLQLLNNSVILMLKRFTVAHMSSEGLVQLRFNLDNNQSHKRNLPETVLESKIDNLITLSGDAKA